MTRARSRCVLLTVALCLAGAAPAAAQVVPDRPDVSNGTATVPPGAAQVEVGVEFARARVAAAPDSRRLALQTTLRAGLAERLEARLEAEPVVRLRGGDDDTGPGDVVLGLKYRFLDARADAPWPALGVLPFVKVPAADEPIGSERADAGVLALASLDLPWELGLAVNAGVVAVGQRRPEGWLVQGVASVALSRELVERLGGFVEVFYASREARDGRDSVGLDAGLVWAVARDVALDVAVETSLAGAGPDYAVRSGVSVRFGR
jgi:hypothetical protein